jgi:Uma2 family endonuclease
LRHEHPHHYEGRQGSLLPVHNVRVGANFHTVIASQLDGAKWSVLEGRGVETAETNRYPDVVVHPSTEPDDSLSTTCPAVVIEVLSPSSADRDLFVKPAEYLSLASLEAYIVASQSEPSCKVWLRGADREFADEPTIASSMVWTNPS